MVISADPRPGYDEPSQHLADWSELFARMVDRMVTLKARTPRGAAVLSEHDRARLVASDPELAGFDREIATRTAEIGARARFARRLGVALPIEILRERFALAPVDIELLGALATIERGTAFNPYTMGKNEPLQADVAFLVALIANGDTMLPGEVRLRFSADAPLVAHGLVELSASNGWSADPPLVYKRVRIADRVLDFIEGAQEPPPSILGAVAKFVPQPIATADVLLPDPSLVEQVTRALSRPDQAVVLAGSPGVGRKSIAGAAARALGRPLLVIDLAEVPVEIRGLDAALAPLIREAHLQDAVLAIDRAHDYADADGQAWIHPRLTELLRRVRTPLVFVGEKAPSWVARAGRVPMHFDVPFPTPEVQRRLWVRHLPPGLRLAPDLSLEALCKRYSATGASIKEACEELGRLDVVHQRGGTATEAHIINVVRSRLAHRLSSLATRVGTPMSATLPVPSWPLPFAPQQYRWPSPIAQVSS